MLSAQGAVASATFDVTAGEAEGLTMSATIGFWGDAEIEEAVDDEDGSVTLSAIRRHSFFQEAVLADEDGVVMATIDFLGVTGSASQAVVSITEVGDSLGVKVVVDYLVMSDDF